MYCNAIITISRKSSEIISKIKGNFTDNITPNSKWSGTLVKSQITNFP